MITSKGLNVVKIAQLSKYHTLWLIALSSIIAALYYFKILSFNLPWLPVSIIGTAVAFFVGFKNNQAYDRMWEARKIWGGIVNDSRKLGMQLDAYISNDFALDIDDKELKSIKKRLINRHLAWLYTHRNQLLKPTSWEHGSQDNHLEQSFTKYQSKLGIDMVSNESEKIKLSNFLSKEELEKISNVKNKATQIINEQSRDLSQLRKNSIIDDLRHFALMKTLGEFYVLQGQNERIKNFPLPRQYANISRYFTGIFLFLLPFSMIPELMSNGIIAFWISIPITAIIGWVYVMMELIGEYTENPFEGMPNDIPMLSLCRNIEIDLKEMLMEKDLPEAITSKNNILL